MKKASNETKAAAKGYRPRRKYRNRKAYDKTAEGTKRATHETVKGTERAYDKTAEGQRRRPTRP
jgi:hypothetical protein